MSDGAAKMQACASWAHLEPAVFGTLEYNAHATKLWLFRTRMFAAPLVVLFLAGLHNVMLPYTGAASGQGL